MIVERAAINYALLKTDTTLYPRGVFREYLSLEDSGYSSNTLKRVEAEIKGHRRQAQQAQGQKRAFLELLADDTERAILYLKEHEAEIENLRVEKEIEDYFKVAEEYYSRRLELDWERVDFFVVDRFPTPLQDRDWFAFAGTAGSPLAGIYYLRRHMMPDIVQLSTLHENVHSAAKGTGGYLRYFDEGIANFLAYTVYIDHAQSTSAVFTFHAFLDEINVLYAYPPMLRIMASIVQQVGMRGLYRMIRRRVSAPEQVDWRAVLVASRAGRLSALLETLDDAGMELPPAVDDLQAAAETAVSLISFPETALVSPLAAQVYASLCAAGTLSLAEVRRRWHLSEAELAAVLSELQDPHAVWAVQGDQLVMFGQSELLRETGLIRADARFGPTGRGVTDSSAAAHEQN